MALRLSNHTKLLLPKISRPLMQWKNKLSTKRESIGFSLAGFETNFTTRIHATHFDNEAYKLGLLVEIDGVPASIWLTSWPLTKRLEGYLAGKELDKLPVDLRAELLEAAFKPLLSVIMFQTNTKIRVLNFLNLKPSNVNTFSLGLIFCDESIQHESKLIILMHDKLLPVMEKLLAYWPDQENDFWYHKNTELWLQAGSLELSLQELNQLEASDILIAESSGSENQIHLRLGSGDFFYANIHSNQLTLESGVQKMSDESHEEAIPSIDDIPVRLTFDLGDLILPFKKVQSLTQGSILDLNAPISQAVTIRSLNRVIGTGELVNLDGQMGVRIVKLFSQKPVASTNG